jgi:hypothetical protein
MKDRPYIVISPAYSITSGGTKVMYGLYGWLLAKGCEVYMNCTPNSWHKDELISIYPEIQDGNPVGTSRVVRYVLNTPGIMRGFDDKGNMLTAPTNFDGEMVYYFSRMFGDTDDDHYMFLPVINTHIFKDQKKKRKNTCYLVGKGNNKHKHPENSIELNRKVASSQTELNDILNSCHTLYCYDNLTAMMEVARLSGCRVEYHGKYTMKELTKYEPGLNGINSELDVDKFREHYLGMVDAFEEQLDKFLEETNA